MDEFQEPDEHYIFLALAQLLVDAGADLKDFDAVQGGTLSFFLFIAPAPARTPEFVKYDKVFLNERLAQLLTEKVLHDAPALSGQPVGIRHDGEELHQRTENFLTHFAG